MNISIWMSILQHRTLDSDLITNDMGKLIHHELRTPLNAIVGFSQLLRQNDLSAVKIHSYTEIIEHNSLRLMQVTEGLLALYFASVLNTNYSEFSINQCFDELENEFLEYIKQENKDLKLVRVVNTSALNIRTDKSQIIAVFNHLFNNAIKFTEAGNIEFGCFDRENKLVFYVKDLGIGISKKYFNKIFEPFFSINTNSDNGSKGMGLGLAISKQLVKNLQGDIWFKSELNNGSCFYFSLSV